MDKRNTLTIVIAIVSLLYCLNTDYWAHRYEQTRIEEIERNSAITEELKQLNTDLSLKTEELTKTAGELNILTDDLKNHKVVNMQYIGEYKCTAYCCEKYPHICGGSGKTASGQPIQANVSVAVTDLKKLPYGTVIYIEDVGIRIVQDTGNFPKTQIDVAVATHTEALNWAGQGKHRVYILEVE